MQIIKDEGSAPIKAWVGMKDLFEGQERTAPQYVPDIEDSALRQLKNLARLPFIGKNGVAVMPDVHAGIGSTVGSVIATHKAIIPAAVGVDIGCGMNAVQTSLKAHQLPDNLKDIFLGIEGVVPVGMSSHQESSDQYHVNVLKMPAATNMMVRKSLAEVGKRRGREAADDDFGISWRKAISQLGTLGSGNHFIEICIDESQNVWVMLHSGSRGIGNQIGTMFIKRAKKNMEKMFITLPDADLAYFPEDTDDFNEYVEAVSWAQNYALENRRVMMENVVAVLRKHIPIAFTITQEAINCHHNYVEKEHHFGQSLWVTRKGAIRAREGDLGIIPGSMGQRSYIVRGKGNLQSYCSCSHGAGRVMSRTEARKTFTVADLAAQTEGVECRKDDARLDEIPSSYKDIDVVMSHQLDLVEVKHTLKQVLCVKG